MYALRRSRVLGVRSGVLVAWARRMHPMHGQRTAPRQESRKWTADPGRTLHDSRADRQNAESQTRHPSSLPLSILRPGGAAAVPGAPVSAAALRSARLGCARSVCCRAEQPCAVLRWSRGAWSARARVRSTDARREMGVCDGGRRRLKYGSGRACAATVVRSDARGPAPQSAAPTAFWGGEFCPYRLSCGGEKRHADFV